MDSFLAGLAQEALVQFLLWKVLPSAGVTVVIMVLSRLWTRWGPWLRDASVVFAAILLITILLGIGPRSTEEDAPQVVPEIAASPTPEESVAKLTQWAADVGYSIKRLDKGQTGFEYEIILDGIPFQIRYEENIKAIEVQSVVALDPSHREAFEAKSLAERTKITSYIAAEIIKIGIFFDVTMPLQVQVHTLIPEDEMNSAARVLIRLGLVRNASKLVVLLINERLATE